MVKLEKVLLIKEQYQEGISKSQIAENMNLDWKTVNKYINMDDFNETVEDHAKSIRGSKLDPYKPEIDAMLEEEMKSNLFHKQHFTAVRVHEILWRDRGYKELEHSYHLVRLYMNGRRLELRRNVNGPGTSVLNWNPGEAQADFGESDFVERGVFRRYKCFILSFPYSNRKIMVAMPGENCECVCLALQTIFLFIGGVPNRIVFDNATGIGRRVCDVMQTAPGFTRFRLHYGFSASFTNPRSGWEKGSVENAVGTLRRNLLVPPLMIDCDLMEFNRNVMMPRSFGFREDEEHYRKGETVKDLFEDDRKALLPLNPKEFTPNSIVSMKTNNCGEVTLEGRHRYCLGPAHANESILVEKTALRLRFSTAGGTDIKFFERDYSEGPTETYDMQSMIEAASRKPRSWRNSIARREMEDGRLKKWLDSLENDGKGLCCALYRLSKASKEFGYADAYTAMDRLVSKSGKLPSSDDISATCRRIRQGGVLSFHKNEGVDLSKFDELITMGKEAANG